MLVVRSRVLRQPERRLHRSPVANQVLQLLNHLSLESATLIGLSNGRVVSQVVGLAPDRVERLVMLLPRAFGMRPTRDVGDH